MLEQIFTYNPRPFFRRLDERLAFTRWRFLHGKPLSAPKDNPKTWEPRVAFRNGYHEQQRKLAWVTLRTLIRRRLKIGRGTAP